MVYFGCFVGGAVVMLILWYVADRYCTSDEETGV